MSLRNNCGDTLVEVLVCIAIVSVILAGAFVVSSHSRQGVENSQEHAVALKLLESQLEQLRNLAPTQSNVFTANGYCIVGGGIVTGGACIVGSNGATITGNQQPAYTLNIQHTPTTDGATFVAKVTWDQITGGQAAEQLSYRIYNDNE